jgi:hypothetical protein
VSGPIEWCHALAFVRQGPLRVASLGRFHDGEQFFSIWFRTSGRRRTRTTAYWKVLFRLPPAWLPAWRRSAEISRPGRRPLGKLDGTGSKPSSWRRCTPIPVAKSPSVQEQVVGRQGCSRQESLRLTRPVNFPETSGQRGALRTSTCRALFDHAASKLPAGL